MGTALADVLLKNGYPVSAWSRTPRQHDAIACYHGQEKLPDFLGHLRVLVCLLPLTPDTEGLINASLFSMLPRGSYFINAGRGKSHDENALLDALNSDQVGR